MNKTSDNRNRLSKEKSPYLLQHAYNPVDWYAWGEEAFKTARESNKPIFLSIGYSTCYWCHVMEREVFENPEIAATMNDYFVNIKVDREERPDVDRVYMIALQAMVGSGGWPMSMFLTPDLKPFYGATYIPPKAKYGRAGFEDVIKEIHNVWVNKEAEVKESGSKVVDILNNRLVKKDVTDDFVLTDDVLHKAFEQIRGIYDYEYGGFGKGNKFPRPVVYNFLLAYYHDTKVIDALDIVTFTLQKMYAGGMYDHLGGGFHRYSVDYLWRVPHFEKMLYDQAQLAQTYLDVYRITKKDFYLQVAEETLQYVLKNLYNKGGGFYSAEDAESAISSETPDEKEEGAFYLWEKDEIEKLLGKNGVIFNHHFGIQPAGNTLSDPHNVFGSKNVLYLANDLYDTAKTFGITPEEAERVIAEAKEKLIAERDKRPRPHLDDKVITSWNGLMISAFAKGYQVTGKKEYLEAASGSADFILDNLFDKEKKVLLRRYRDGEAKYEGSLEDYSFFVTGLIDLYESSFDIKYLNEAITLNSIAFDKFYDHEEGGFFDVEKGTNDIILETKESYDGAEPSGNSFMILNLIKLGLITSRKELTEAAERSLKYFYPEVERTPFSSPQMLLALSFYLHTAKEIILSGDMKKPVMKEMLAEINNAFLAYRVLLHAGKETSAISPFLKSVVSDMKKENVYVCENYMCNLPVSTVDELKKLL
jgi:uncharacterized protein YyaL (SSP411 family)